MYDLSLRFLVQSPMNACCRPMYLGWERHVSQDYCECGIVRKEETSCVWQYTFSGRGRIRHGKKTYDVLPGQGFLAVVNDPDTDYFYPEDGTEEWSFVWFAYEAGPSRELTAEMIDRYTPVFDLSPESETIRYFTALRDSRTEVVEVHAMQGMRIILRLLEELQNQRLLDIAQNMPPLLERTLRIVRESPVVPKVGKLSELLGVTQEHLSRNFRSVMGVSLGDYLAEARCEKARILLASDTLGLKEIANQVAFENTSSFIRMFRQRTGMTPGEYRAHQMRLRCNDGPSVAP